jgi:hypothetical protein
MIIDGWSEIKFQNSGAMQNEIAEPSRSLHDFAQVEPGVGISLRAQPFFAGAPTAS